MSDLQVIVVVVFVCLVIIPFIFFAVTWAVEQAGGREQGEARGDKVPRRASGRGPPAKVEPEDSDGATPTDASAAAKIARVTAQLVGSVAGALGAFVLIVGFSYSVGGQPRGAGWLFFIFGAGVVGSRVGVYVADPSRLRRAGGHWWELDRTLRLVLVVGAVWAGYSSFFWKRSI